MTKIAKISLDIRKDNIIDNEPIILRQGESDVIIEATISNGGYENLQINFATFVAKKPDGTIVSNDPANVNGSVIDYPVSKHLTESVGKIQDAYFVINNEVTTCGFDISIIPSAQLDDTSVNYIPGIESINKFLESAEADWLGRIQQMKSQIDGLDIPQEFKLLMDKALSDAKAQYQPTIDAAEANVESIVADLAAKKLDLTNNSGQLNQTITTIQTQVASVNSFLDSVQKQIIEANASFTSGQQAQIYQSIADSQKKLADSIASMQSEIAQTVTDLKNSSNSAITDMQKNQSTAMAKVNQDITDAEATIQKMQVSAVGTNLLTNSDFSAGLDHWNVNPGNKVDCKAVVTKDSDGDTCVHITGTGIFCGLYLIGISFNQNQVITGSVLAKGTGKLNRVGLANVQTSNFGTVSTESYSKVGSTMQTVSGANPFCIYFDAVNSVVDVYIKFAKLEKGSIATDYSVNPLDISTNASVTKQIQDSVKSVNDSIQNMKIGGRNYIAPNYWKSIGNIGTYHTSDGSLGTNPQDLHSPLITIPNNYNKMQITTYEVSTAGTSSYVFFDKDKNFISGRFFGATVGTISVDIPSNAMYLGLAICDPKVRGGKYKVEFGDISTDWIPAPEDMVALSDITDAIKLPNGGKLPINRHRTFVGQDATKVGNEYWLFDGSSPDHASTTSIHRINPTDFSEIGLITHNLGHANGVDYRDNALLVYNGSGFPPEINLYKNPDNTKTNLSMKDAANTQIIFKESNKVLPGDGSACFGLDNKIVYYAYCAKAQVIILKILLGLGDNDLSDKTTDKSDNQHWGSFVSGKSNDDYNGTAQILTSYTGEIPGDNWPQGMAFNGDLYVGTSHSEQKAYQLQLLSDGSYKIVNDYESEMTDYKNNIIGLEPEITFIDLEKRSLFVGGRGSISNLAEFSL